MHCINNLIFIHYKLYQQKQVKQLAFFLIIRHIFLLRFILFTTLWMKAFMNQTKDANTDNLISAVRDT